MIFTITKSCMDNFSVCCISEQMPRDKVICWLILAYHFYRDVGILRWNNKEVYCSSTWESLNLQFLSKISEQLIGGSFSKQHKLLFHMKYTFKYI